MAKGNYIHCDGCGITYENKGTGCCPNCGAAVQIKKTTEDSIRDMRYSADILPLKSLLSLLGSVALLAAAFVVFAMLANSVMVERAPTQGSDYAAFFRTWVTSMVICAVILIIAAILVLMRFRLSFIVMMGATVLSVVVFVIIQLWGAACDYINFSAYLVVFTVSIVIPIMKECIGCNTLVNPRNGSGGIFNSEDESKKPVGAAMPKVQELYSFEDMPELSGMRGLEDAQPLESQDADDEDDVMDEIAPIGVEQTRSEAPVFKPSEVAPEVQPVVPLTNYQVGGSITDEGENVAVTPLARPMFEVDMMDTESMPDIGGDVPEDSPAMTVSADMSSPTADKPVGIWFCSVCGNLNEHVKVCNGCGSPIK